MKYGILACTPIKNRGGGTFNLGDMAQTEAVFHLYQQMGIEAEKIVYVDINDLNSYNGDYVILPINVNLSLNWIIDIFPLPPRFIPVFLGLSFFSAQPFPRHLKDYFLQHSPIGCRDEATLCCMRENGIPSYLFGCISLTMPKRKEKKQYDTVFLVDAPDKEPIKREVERLSAYYKIETISHIVDAGTQTMTVMDCMGIFRRVLKNYSEKARLVISARLHCLSPCVGMGIPSIACLENISPRFGWIDRILPLYSDDLFQQINWNPEPPDIEDLKFSMLDIAKNKIRQSAAAHEAQCDLSYFFEDRKKRVYGNVYLSRLQQLSEDKKSGLNYVIWGTGQSGMNLYQIIQQHYPDWTMKAAVDSFCTGTFFGSDIQSPESLENMQNVFVFIASYSGKTEIDAYLRKLNKIEHKDYLHCGTKNG